MDYNIADLVPHSKTMLLVDRVISIDNDTLISEVDINSNSLFAEENGVPSSVGIEYMAQSIAAWAGAKDLAAGKSIKIGFLVGTRKYTSNVSHFPLNETLTVHVSEIIKGENGLGVFECSITSPLVEVKASINVFQPDDVDTFLNNEQD